jgi:hypothetical protein
VCRVPREESSIVINGTGVEAAGPALASLWCMTPLRVVASTAGLRPLLYNAATAEVVTAEVVWFGRCREARGVVVLVHSC